MREASFILPISSPSTHALAEDTILAHFGGYSRAETNGAWRDLGGDTYRDTSFEYRVATRWTNAKRNTFVGIALKAAIAAGQDAVYIKLDTGRVLILSTDDEAALPSFGGQWIGVLACWRSWG